MAFESKFAPEGPGQKQKTNGTRGGDEVTTAGGCFGEPAMPASLVRDGKLDREAASAELRRCLDAILRLAHFQLSYRVDIAPQAEAPDLETAEIIVSFDGPDKPLLLERNGDLLKRSRAHCRPLAAARSATLQSGLLRLRRFSSRAHCRIAALRASRRRTRSRDARTLPF